MIKYSVKKWDKNKSELEKVFKNEIGWNECNYLDIVKTAIDKIFNDEEAEAKDELWDIHKITKIDNGDYQGTLLFVIPQDTYEPAEYEYIVTFVRYGSCSGCDTLQMIQSWGDDKLTDEQVKDFMTLSKDIIMNVKKPFNCGWREEEDFKEIEK